MVDAITAQAPPSCAPPPSTAPQRTPGAFAVALRAALVTPSSAEPSTTLGAMIAGLGPETNPRAGCTPPTFGTLPSLAPAVGAAPVGVDAPTAASQTLQLPVVGRVSSNFGPRVHPVTGRQHVHSGLDFAAPLGTPIGAAAAGTVTFAGVRGGYGNLVIVEHGDGRETRYAHADRLLVRPGQHVAAGEKVATVGATGTATGPHLHLEVRVGGRAVDPAPLLAR